MVVIAGACWVIDHLFPWLADLHAKSGYDWWCLKRSLIALVTKTDNQTDKTSQMAEFAQIVLRLCPCHNIGHDWIGFRSSWVHAGAPYQPTCIVNHICVADVAQIPDFIGVERGSRWESTASRLHVGVTHQAWQSQPLTACQAGMALQLWMQLTARQAEMALQLWMQEPGGHRIVAWHADLCTLAESGQCSLWRKSPSSLQHWEIRDWRDLASWSLSDGKSVFQRDVLFLLLLLIINFNMY